jgi:hypothetical protein
MLNRRPPHASLVPPDPFSREPGWRRLCLIVDLSVGESTEAGRLLRAHGSTSAADVLIADPDAPFRIVLHPPVLEPPGRDYIPAEVVDIDGGYLTAISAATYVRDVATELAVRHDRDQLDMQRLVALHHFADTSHRVDAFVTDDPLVAAEFKSFPRARTLSEGVALLGLALRARGDFSISRDGGISTYLDDESFYKAAALSLLDGLEPWYRRAAGAYKAGRPKPFELLHGTMARIARVLRARDYVQIRLRSCDFESAWAELLFFFDALLVALSGALDTLARFVHDVYGLPEDEARRASWNRESWRKRLAVEDAPLAQAATRGELARVSRIISLLRNRVHEAPLSEEVHLEKGGTMSVGAGAIALPRHKDSLAMLDLVAKTGGHMAWGLRDRPEFDAIMVDPGIYAERAIRMVTSVIAQVLASADGTRLGPEDLARIEGFQGGDPPQSHRHAAFMLCGLGPRGEGYWVDRVTH